MEASDDADLQLPCASKLAFDTIKEARVIKLLSEQRYHSKLKAYRCPYCHLFHLASDDDE